MGTFNKDYSLPSLPIPSLDDTCELLKQFTKPLLNPSEWERTCAAIDKLSKEAGPLHNLLLAHRKAKPNNASWLRPLWDDIYMTYRGALPVNMNYCFELVCDRLGMETLSKFVAAMSLVVQKIRVEAQSMEELQQMIYTRIPCTVRDVWFNPPLAAPMSVAVVCKGHWFIMTVVNDKGELLAPSAIEEALLSIRKLSGMMGKAVGVGSMTAGMRIEAAYVRDNLLKNPMNRMSFEAIEKCVFAVCLDEALASQEDFGRDLLGGDGANRWFDKSLQIISEPGGRMGVNLEHSGCDAAIWVYVFNRADKLICSEKLPDGQGCAHVRPLEWRVDKKMTARLKSFREEHARKMETISIRQRRITSVTKELIKSKKCSPDAFAQLLFQAAYYKEKKKFRSVYEAVSTRAFYQGRTECVRPVTEESTAFVRALYEGRDSRGELLDKFRLAEKAHIENINRGQQALGPERHMTGLLYMYAMHEGAKGLVKPEIFDDKGYLTLRHDSLSTSSTTSDNIDYFGLGPTVEDGLGIGYGLKPDGLHMMVSSYEKSDMSADVFLDNVEEAAKKFLEVFTSTAIL